jgi:phospholipid/cholesterol/gamma-HCH transport system permease protein
MRAREQIDGIESLSIDAFKFLVVPRVVACVIALPLLTLFMDFWGLLGGFLSEFFSSRISFQLYHHSGIFGFRLVELYSTNG